MKKFVLLTCVMTWSSFAIAGSVLWNAFAVVDDGAGGKLIELNGNGFDVSFYVSAYQSGGLWLTATANDARQGTAAPISTYISGAWMSAMAGDMVNSSMLLDNSECLFNELHGETFSLNQTDVSIVAGQSHYLKFALQNFNEAYAYLIGSADGIPSLYYGWMEFAYEDSEFQILQSAIGLTGQSMVVGSTPEPTGSILVLCGLAVLGLRRKETAIFVK